MMYVDVLYDILDKSKHCFYLCCFYFYHFYLYISAVSISVISLTSVSVAIKSLQLVDAVSNSCDGTMMRCFALCRMMALMITMTNLNVTATLKSLIFISF